MSAVPPVLTCLRRAEGISNGLREALHIFAAENALSAKPAQVKHNVRTVLYFLRVAGVTELALIDHAAIVRYLTSLSVAPKTLRNHLSSLGCFCAWLEKRGVLAGNPARGLRLSRIPKRTPHWLDDAAVKQCLILARRYGIHSEVALALHTGLRREELRLLRWEQVDLCTAMLSVQSGKSIDPRRIPLNSVAMQVLKRERAKANGKDFVFSGWNPFGKGLRNGPRGVNWWRLALKPICDGIPAFKAVPKGHTGHGWHMFRHTFATRLLHRGGEKILPKISRWVGHQSVAFTMDTYAHLAEGWDEDIEKLV